MDHYLLLACRKPSKFMVFFRFRLMPVPIGVDNLMWASIPN